MKQVFCALLLFFILPGSGKGQDLYFPPGAGSEWDTLSLQSLNWCPQKVDSLYDFLEENRTKAFIVLKDGKIVLEKYFGEHDQNANWYWASAGKTLTAFMVGIAQQEDYLHLSDTASDYLGQGWTDCTPEQEQKITILHQLTMTSGLDDSVDDNFCTRPECLLYKADPGTRWAYHNAPYTLLDRVIEAATGTNLNIYITRKLKATTGMTGAFVRVGDNNVYFSNARSMARFGLLILNKGKWGGEQIMTDQEYFDRMVNTSQDMNSAYGYLWWLNGKSGYMLPQSQIVFNGYLMPDAPSDMISGLGMNGQFLNVVPGRNMVVIRMGEAPDSFPVPSFMNNRIWQYISELDCQQVNNEEKNYSRHKLNIFPNPASDRITIQSESVIFRLEVINIDGKVIQTISPDDVRLEVDISQYVPGMYQVKALYGDGNVLSKRIIVGP